MSKELEKLEQLKGKLQGNQGDCQAPTIENVDIEEVVRKVIKEELAEALKINQDETVKRLMNYIFQQKKDLLSILGRKLNTLIDKANSTNGVEDEKEKEKRELLERLKELGVEV